MLAVADQLAGSIVENCDKVKGEEVALRMADVIGEFDVNRATVMITVSFLMASMGNEGPHPEIAILAMSLIAKSGLAGIQNAPKPH